MLIGPFSAWPGGRSSRSDSSSGSSAVRGARGLHQSSYRATACEPLAVIGGRDGSDGVGEAGWATAGAALGIDPRRRVELGSAVGQSHVPPGVVDQPVARAADHDAVGQRCLAALLPGKHVVHLAPRGGTAAPGAAAVAGCDRPPQSVGDHAGGPTDVQVVGPCRRARSARPRRRSTASAATRGSACRRSPDTRREPGSPDPPGARARSGVGAVRHRRARRRGRARTRTRRRALRPAVALACVGPRSRWDGPARRPPRRSRRTSRRRRNAPSVCHLLGHGSAAGAPR